MRKRPNEIDAISCFMEILKNLNGRQYEIERRPEETNRLGKDIDFIIGDINGNDAYAVEHTVIESFNTQIEYVKAHFELIKKIENRLVNELPIDRYFVISASDQLISGKNKKEKEKLENAIIEILRLHAFKMLPESYENHNINGYPIIIECNEGNEILSKGLVPIQLAPGDSERKQIDRLTRAINDKIQKLLKHRENGLKACLLLEDVAGLGRSEMLHALPNELKTLINNLDYIVCFISNDQKMIVGNIWKLNNRIFKIVPMKYRYSFRERKI